MSKKRTKLKITKGERLIYLTAIFCLFGSFIMQVFCGASIGDINVNIEKIKYEVTSQEKTNESLTMKVNELTAFDNIKDIVKDMGLEYNNDNIIVINK